MATIQQFNSSVDLLKAILWQFNDATRLQALITEKQAWYDVNQRDFWNNWRRDVFDLRTANDFGLNIWAMILNVPLVYDVAASDNRPVFGFGVHNLNFFDGNFGRDQDAALSLTVEQKRIVLQLRYFQLVTNGTVPQINAFIRPLLGDVYVLDGNDMTATYIFNTAPSSAVRLILERFDLLPRPAGVEVEYLVSPADVFGFAPYYLNFNNGTFARAS